ncbi:trehalose-6-phosphate synthase [Thermobispora bispora]|uniref:Alpha,alpha-trehalose-phosphate synthase (UDP-forming) n=1 Tax=Thermobispora bispora (strain ATCC 19993 / DSM 43833 / CBS 139.67 / JCM 10125 / KCTC 9307 / NBRC 14880 / R51) TaxID=469371 RepID=D6Y3C9_THEBD|nr:trehalose-6-phosphate synthase [Thermobispora bispora]MBO2474641.1 trehalose-6-phosphate synthase [Actinomycetales bacterium]MDI9579812.1 trehalose-6-phosphate synthase [Thermobispora sp.]ADG89004.1 Alpha,alpha-trehalose-phosphate synthase (UDP- forming) [Thermobispora bispora DSM 43833]MBX6166929.1 trehalose-6-phosphate synthase [Thermobispora bispora]QSI48735.1 trehalose-6-phosphate synthase [Thermobispora bispora]
MRSTSSFLVVANRLPVDRVGDREWRRSPGGLVTAIAPVMQRRDGAWLGWTGAAGEELKPFDHDGMHLIPVPLSAREVELYYEGFSNATLWPLYHDVVAPPVYSRVFWDAYRAVNERFARAAADVADPGAVVWIQDYHLQLVPMILRRLRPDLKIGFFLHIPFPPIELFCQLPWRSEIVEGLLGADLVGFQRPGGASNFLRLCRRLLGLHTHRNEIYVDGRTVRVDAFPISVDFAEFDQLARDPRVQDRAKEIRAELGDPEHVLLGVDRLDYTKGIGQRLKAFGELLDEGVITPDEAVFVQVATPTREGVPAYARLRNEIELRVGRINGEHGMLGRQPISYLHQSYDREELAALYCAADVLVVTPLRDGMNLVAKEYVSCRFDLRGALVLSEFAGAADELRQAFLVNPYDIEGMKRAMLAAMRATPHELARRMRSLRRRVATHNVDKWANDFLSALEER